jgi:hypothetical protein
VDIAEDILGLWNGFSKLPELKPYSSLLDQFREKAIEETLIVAKNYKQHGFESPFAKFAIPKEEK